MFSFRQWGLFSSIALFLVLSAKAQEPECSTKRNLEDFTMLDYHCRCLEKFSPEIKRPHTIYVNQTGDCKDKAFHLDWKSLRSITTLRKIVINGATLSFGDRSSSVKNEYVTEIVVENAKITYLPAHAFRGLDKLETLRFVQTSFNVIQQNSFANLDSLKIVKILGSTINKIESEAFANLPSIDNISFLKTDIADFSPEAIKLEAQKKDNSQGCVRGRSIQDIQHMFGRSLTDSEDIALPEDGASLFMYKCTIGKMSSKAIVTNVFPFIILGGNTFNTLEAYAFQSHLDNGCELSAFLAIENKFKHVKSEAFGNLSGDSSPLSRSFIVFSANVFGRVDAGGFQIDPSFQVYNVQSNQFECVCNNFAWFRDHEASKSQNKLEVQLASSDCETGNLSLVDFALSCDHSFLETPTEISSGTSFMDLTFSLIPLLISTGFMIL